MWCKARITRKVNKTKMHGLMKLAIMMSVTALGAIFGIWLSEVKHLSQMTCDNEESYARATFQCHCPKKWLAIRANGFVTRQPNIIQPCEGVSAWIVYPLELLCKYVVVTILVAGRLLGF